MIDSSISDTDDSLSIVATFTYVMDAELARTKLESEDIYAVLRDKHLVYMQWFYSHAVGGVKLLVRQADLERARAILGEQQPPPSHDTTSTPAWGRCPKCDSTDVSYSRRPTEALALLTILLVTMPLFFWKKRLQCSNCEHRWPLSEEG